MEVHLLLSFASCIPLIQFAYQSVPYQRHGSIKLSRHLSIQSRKFYNLPAGRKGVYGIKEFSNQQNYFGRKFLTPAGESKNVADDL